MRCALAFVLAAMLPLPLIQAKEGDTKGAGKPHEIKAKLSDTDPKDRLARKSPHKAYPHKMKAGQIYVIALSSGEFDSLLRLEAPGGKQVAVDDDSGGGPRGLDARIVHKAAQTGDYKIIVTSADGKAGAFTLTVREGTAEDLAKADPHYAILGKKAPDIVGEFSFNGKARKLSDLKGKVVLLDFWAVWCGPCIGTFPHLRKWEEEYRKDGLEIVGATTYFARFGFDPKVGRLTRPESPLTTAEEHDMVKDFVAHHKLKHEILVVSKANWKKASADYRVRGIPQVVLIDRQGIVRMVRVGNVPQNVEDLEGEIKKLLKQK
jgi:thiol-disulfide isomerase/thioredoxin